MGRSSEEARPGWVRLSGSSLWRWEGGPLVIRLKVAEGWYLELSRHGLNGRIDVVLDGPCETFLEAAECAEARLPACRGSVIKGEPLRALRFLTEQVETGRITGVDRDQQADLIREAKASGIGLRAIGEAAGVSLDHVYRVAA